MTDFHALYVRYAPQVHRFALFLCDDPTLADDITSDTFVRAWTAPGVIRHETVKAYLFTIARNLYFDSIRHRRRHAVLGEAIPDGRVSPQKQAEVRSDLDLVLAAMRELPEIDRAALLLRVQEEMSYEEISQALGLSLAAVKVKIHRARLNLMRAVKAPESRSRASEEGS
ncbi:MAG: RNA polymerase sigma factor [Terracidiphilus sp.]|jgi:RNA polymerase sigma-70 factor (ECF subfamily)